MLFLAHPVAVTLNIDLMYKYAVIDGWLIEGMDGI